MRLSALRRYWVPIFLVLLILLALHVRLLDYRWPYLRNIDSYLFYRDMDDIVQHGYLSTFDSLARVPEGVEKGVQLFPYQYLGAYSYLFVRLFFPMLQLWQYLIFFPAFLAALMAIPMYFIVKTLYDKKAGVLAATFIVFDITIMSRTLGGDPDTDAITLLVPLIVMALFLYTYKLIHHAEKLQAMHWLAIGVTGIALGIWTHTWIGYWYIVWLITGFILLHVVRSFMATRTWRLTWVAVKNLLIMYAVCIVILFIFTAPFYGISRFFYTFTGPIEFQSIKTEEGHEFPNVGVSVAELQSAGDIKSVIKRTSAIDFDSNPYAALISPFFLMIYGLIYLGYSFFKKRQHFDTFVLLAIWFLGPLLATTVAVRFSILFSAPIAIGSAIFLSKLWRLTTGEDTTFED